MKCKIYTFLSAFALQVQGIGPTFKFTVKLQNTSLSQSSSNLFITFDYDEQLYDFRKKLIQVKINPCPETIWQFSPKTNIECFMFVIWLNKVLWLVFWSTHYVERHAFDRVTTQKASCYKCDLHLPWGFQTNDEKIQDILNSVDYSLAT